MLWKKKENEEGVSKEGHFERILGYKEALSQENAVGYKRSLVRT